VELKPERSVQVGPVTVRYVHVNASYALLEWSTPAGADSPPVHVHHSTDEGFQVLSGTFGFLLDEKTFEVSAGSHVFVGKGHPHTLWNAGHDAASCLVVLVPPGFAEYFSALADGLAANQAEDAAMEVRKQLSAGYDIEVVGPPVRPARVSP
jgi:mannose-6-phosphate isomerase-like protein (cupin superfamily)